jgi:hypothetical protein
VDSIWPGERAALLGWSCSWTLLHLRVNGTEIKTGRWWDYAGNPDGMYGDKDGRWKRDFGLDLRPGDPVTIEIAPERIAGAWQVIFAT